MIGLAMEALATLEQTHLEAVLPLFVVCVI